MAQSSRWPVPFGQLDPELTPLAGSGFHASPAAHPLRAFGHNGQAHPGPGIHFRPVQAFKDAEDAIMILRRDPDAVVLHAHAAPLVSFVGPAPDRRTRPRL